MNCMVLAVLLLHPLVAQGAPVQWRQLGPWGSYCEAVAVKPDDGRIVYAGTSNGLYRSETTGQSWRQITGGLPGGAHVRCVAIDPLTPQSIAYVGLYGDGVYKTTDDGVTWSPANSGLTNQECFSIAISPLASDLLYAGTEAGVFRSTNGGATWTLSGLSSRTVWSLDHDSETSWRVYAGTDRGMYRRNELGVWDEINNGLPTDPLGNPPIIYSAKVDSQTPNILLAGGLSLGENPDLYKSTDHGDNWVTMGQEQGFPQADIVTAVSTHVPSVYHATVARGAYRSTDGGNQWTEINTGLPEVSDGVTQIAHLQSLTVSPSASQVPVLFCGVLGFGVFRSVVGSDSWIPANRGLSSSTLAAVYVLPADANRIYAGYGNPGFGPDTEMNSPRSTDGGFSWIPTTLCTAVYSFDFDPSEPLRGFAGTINSWFQGNVMRTVDGGATWTTVLTPEAPYKEGPFAAVRIGLTDATTVSVVYAGHSMKLLPGPIYKSVDSGANWTVTYLGAITDIYDIDILPGATETIHDTVYVGSGNGVYRSTNGGSTWENTGLTGLSVRDLDFALPQYHIFAGVKGNGVYKSTDGGFTWEPKNNGLTDLTVQALALDPGPWQAPSTQVEIYVGTSSGGVFYSDNGGDSWTPINTGLTCLNICDIFIRSTYGVSTIYLATCGHDASGVWVHSVEH